MTKLRHLGSLPARFASRAIVENAKPLRIYACHLPRPCEAGTGYGFKCGQPAVVMYPWSRGPIDALRSLCDFHYRVQITSHLGTALRMIGKIDELQEQRKALLSWCGALEHTP